MEESDEPRPPAPKHLSKTPSWISLGFILGVLFIWALPEPETGSGVPEEPAPVQVPQPEPTAIPRLSEIEAVFAEWGQHAVWHHDLTEVALWDVETRRFSRFYEVLRLPDRYYFRTIDRLTRPVLTHGVKADGPLLYTETEEMRQEWLSERRETDWKAITDSIPKPTVSAPRPTSDEGR
jgi:hypothetical protein